MPLSALLNTLKINTPHLPVPLTPNEPFRHPYCFYTSWETSPFNRLYCLHTSRIRLPSPASTACAHPGQNQCTPACAAACRGACATAARRVPTPAGARKHKHTVQRAGCCGQGCAGILKGKPTSALKSSTQGACGLHILCRCYWRHCRLDRPIMHREGSSSGANTRSCMPHVTLWISHACAMHSRPTQKTGTIIKLVQLTMGCREGPWTSESSRPATCACVCQCSCVRVRLHVRSSVKVSARVHAYRTQGPLVALRGRRPTIILEAWSSLAASPGLGRREGLTGWNTSDSELLC